MSNVTHVNETFTSISYKKMLRSDDKPLTAQCAKVMSLLVNAMALECYNKLSFQSLYMFDAAQQTYI